MSSSEMHSEQRIASTYTADTVGELAADAARAYKRLERASREAAQASAKLRDAMRVFADEHPKVQVLSELDSGAKAPAGVQAQQKEGCHE